MRTLLLALLALTVATAAEAQTTPAKKPAVKTKTAARRVARRPARRPAPVSAPAPDAAQNTNIAPPPEAPASAGGQGAYAAPGMPINPNSGKNVGDYNSSKLTTKPGSTLNSGKR